jgi:hypothetical protein
MSTEPEVFTTTQVAQLFGLGSSAAARKKLSRAGIKAAGRVPGSDEKQWPAKQVLDLAANAPGRGARTDIKKGTP